MSARGRRRSWTEEERERVLELAAEGASQRAIADTVFGNARFRGRVERILHAQASASDGPPTPRISGDPSCLYVSYIYDRQLFEDGTNDLIVGAVRAWRERLAEKLREAAEVHPPRVPVDPDALADHVFATFEGAFMLTRAMSDPDLMRRQLELVRGYVALLFGVPAG